MKKIILAITIAVITLTSCGKEETAPIQQPKKVEEEVVVPPSTNQNEKPQEPKLAVSFEVIYPKELEETLYPALIYSLSGLKNDDGSLKSVEYFQFKSQSNKSFSAKIRVTNSKFIEETILFKNIEAGETTFEIPLKWKTDTFKNITTAGQTFFQFELIDQETNKVLANKNMQLSYRAIDECVFNVNGIDFDDLYASYVNEDSPVIDAFLKEVGEFWKLAQSVNSQVLPFQGWVGEQLNFDYSSMQLSMIMTYLHGSGYTYSSITDTSAGTRRIGIQRIRFIENTIANKQANCVDGSVMLASIFRQIGFNPFLVAEPQHMYMGLIFKGGEVRYIETTAIGNPNMAGAVVYELKNPNSKIINIKDVRLQGIKPIQ